MSIRTLNALRKIAAETSARPGLIPPALRSIRKLVSAPGSVFGATQGLPANIQAQLMRAMRPQGVVSNYETGDYPTGGFADTMRGIYDGTFGRALRGKSNPYPSPEVYSSPNYGTLNPLRLVVDRVRKAVQSSDPRRGLGAASGLPGSTGR